MAIVQDAYYIPDDIAIKLATGVYRRIGSVIRYAEGPNKGRIVKHLEPIDLKENEQLQGLWAKAFQFVQQHKKETGVVAIGAAVIGLGIWGYDKLKNCEPKIAKEFRMSLKIYIEGIRRGDMSIDKITNLMKKLDALSKHKDYHKICLNLTIDELENLVSRIYEYTVKLATDNSIELSEEELYLSNDTIINLQTYLKAQQRIFQAVG